MTGQIAGPDPLVDSVTAALVSFGRALRARGVAIGHDRLATAVEALAQFDRLDADAVYLALRTTLCSSRADLPVFDAVFLEWIRGVVPDRVPPMRSRTLESTLAGATNEPTSRDLSNADLEDAGERASTAERLRTAAFDELTESERREVDRLIALLQPRSPMRRVRRTRPGRGRGIDTSRTVRAMLRAGGEPARFVHRERRHTPRRIVVLLDVSASMAPYAPALLRFAHAAVQVAPYRCEAFTIGTRLTRITRALRQRDADAALRDAGATIPDWSGGTRLGETLRAFLDRWGQRGAARQAVVLIASDGWERGDATLLGEQVARLSRIASSVIWINPHRGKPGFRPATAGMRAVAPHVDHVVAGHNLDALTELTEVMAHA